MDGGAAYDTLGRQVPRENALEEGFSEPDTAGWSNTRAKQAELTATHRNIGTTSTAHEDTGPLPHNMRAVDGAFRNDDRVGGTGNLRCALQPCLACRVPGSQAARKAKKEPQCSERARPQQVQLHNLPPLCNRACGEASLAASSPRRGTTTEEETSRFSNLRLPTTCKIATARFWILSVVEVALRTAKTTSWGSLCAKAPASAILSATSLPKTILE